MGEDIRDALANPGWRCPCCRGICNCSGATCLRKSHGLGTTGQLVLEAKSLGYPSVCCYHCLLPTMLCTLQTNLCNSWQSPEAAKQPACTTSCARRCKLN